MKNIVENLEYDQLLDMVSGFQWLKETDVIRLSARLAIDDPILEALELFTREIVLLHQRSSEDYATLILKVMTNHPALPGARLGREVAAVAAQVIDTIGVGQQLIGMQNLATVAYALVIRNHIPSSWNQFCTVVDKVEWQATVTQGPSSGVQRSVGIPARRNTSKAAARRVTDGQDRQVSDGRDSGEGDDDHEVLEDHIRQRHPGLASAFDDAEFNEMAEKLLGGGHDPETEPPTTTPSAGGPPKRCSGHHQVIQDRYSPARYGKPKRRGV
ncbi:hypothetical protein [Desulfopila aestuarii]|uniref:Uncharacterized protein n=1 Tax=Desulfopila aestuarii DSM 18488 TaxID=1121416 RepID=A0A1M7YK23_9BACT|nr:hypothetical protein [Desulfopila aestuarii]SHO52969.1 hypothetical protein SAMN02745220_04860 [Desulfopila aestuarii DSM 18488]